MELVATTDTPVTFTTDNPAQAVTLTVTDTATGAGVPIAQPTSSDGVTWTLTVGHSALTLGGRYEFAWTVNPGTASESTIRETYWCVSSVLTSYGSVIGVQSYLGSLLTISPTSQPSDAEVAVKLELESSEMDSRLAAVGYIVPITDASAKRLLDRIANLYVTEMVYRRLAAGRDPSAMPHADDWGKEAEERFSRIIEHQTALRNVPRDPETQSQATPTVTTSAAPYSSQAASLANWTRP